MPIIAVACAKGGVAKTTTAMMLARALTVRGKHVLVLDADQTGGATKWADDVMDSGQQLGFDVIPVNIPYMQRDRLQQRYPGLWVVIDTPPSDTSVIDAAVQAADITIIPTTPSPPDMMLASQTYAAIPQSLVLMTKVKAHTKLARQALADLDEAEVSRFETVVPDRESVKRLWGSTASDVAYAAIAGELVDVVAQLGEE